MTQLQAIGTIKIYEGKKERLVNTVQNRMTRNGFRFMLESLIGAAPERGYSELLIGTKRTSSIQSDEMENIVFTKAITGVAIIDTTLIIDTYIEVNEANFEWGQIALRAGYDTFNIAEVSIKKNELKGTTISWEINLSNVE